MKVPRLSEDYRVKLLGTQSHLSKRRGGFHGGEFPSASKRAKLSVFSSCVSKYIAVYVQTSLTPHSCQSCPSQTSLCNFVPFSSPSSSFLRVSHCIASFTACSEVCVQSGEKSLPVAIIDEFYTLDLDGETRKEPVAKFTLTLILRAFSLPLYSTRHEP